MEPHHQPKIKPPTPRTCTNTYRINLPWQRPPLTENQRLHRMAEARWTSEIRRATGWLVKAAKIPAAEYCDVTLYWTPRHHRKRDAENPTTTYKAICDGIVDAGIVKDDIPELMTKHMTVILPPAETGAMWLEITITQTKSGDANDLTRGTA